MDRSSGDSGENEYVSRFPFSSSHFPANPQGLAMYISLGVLFFWKLEIVNPKVQAFPICCKPCRGFHFSVPGL